MRVVFAGGGTGGHILPALSVADELRSRAAELRALFIGSANGLEARLVPLAGYPIRFISARGARGKGLVARVRSAAGLAVGFVQSVAILSRFKPDLVFGSGGYASAAAVLAAAFLRKTVVIQEQNSIPGLTNRLLGRSAARIYLGFERARSFFGTRPGVIATGNPIRREISSERRAEDRAAFGLAPGKPVLLVFGGSQGAHRLNRAAVDYLFAHRDVQAIMQTGERDLAWVEEKLRGDRHRVFVAPYLDNMCNAYGAADAALSRAGALSCAELAAAGMPAILVPYPHAADNHQYFNALALAEGGGAVIIGDAELDARSLEAVLDPLLASPQRLAAMRAAILATAKADAAKLIADDIERLLSAKDAGRPRAAPVSAERKGA
jgi:UDP-N-acetylglucosamine--N-acetylmuramyl-(pentapeptide) pyrophosphoryl-undecaprenol N-acetylglucosamine transferase